MISPLLGILTIIAEALSNIPLIIRLIALPLVGLFYLVRAIHDLLMVVLRFQVYVVWVTPQRGLHKLRRGTVVLNGWHIVLIETKQGLESILILLR